jgi:hypothetical protein
MDAVRKDAVPMYSFICWIIFPWDGGKSSTFVWMTCPAAFFMDTGAQFLKDANIIRFIWLFQWKVSWRDQLTTNNPIEKSMAVCIGFCGS